MKSTELCSGQSCKSATLNRAQSDVAQLDEVEDVAQLDEIGDAAELDWIAKVGELSNCCKSSGPVLRKGSFLALAASVCK